jgi:hypothetical protein
MKKIIVVYLYFLFGKNYCLKQKYETSSKRVRGLVFNATFNTISVISWLSVLLVEETRVPGEGLGARVMVFNATFNNISVI